MTHNHKTRKIILQLYITSKCNQNCKYCYLKKYKHEPLTFEKFKSIIDDYIRILKKSSKIYNYKGHVLLTGGNPFLRDEFYPLLSLLYKYRNYLTYSVASNGVAIDDETCFKLKAFKVKSVRLPLEGSKEFHDNIRCIGSFDTIINALDTLHKNKIETNITFTAAKVKIDSDFSFKLFKHSDINSCSYLEDKHILTVNDCGNIYNKNIPIVCGNVYDTSLYDVYFNNPIFKNAEKYNN